VRCLILITGVSIKYFHVTKKSVCTGIVLQKQLEALIFHCPLAGLAITFLLDQKSNQKNHPGLYPQGPRARGHFFRPPHFNAKFNQSIFV
jgi:hypothetical protein